jgi:hypothetical protein
MVKVLPLVAVNSALVAENVCTGFALFVTVKLDGTSAPAEIFTLTCLLIVIVFIVYN